MKGRDQGRIHGPKGVGRKFFGLLQRTACLVIKKGVSATQTCRGWKDTSAPTFKSGRGTIAPHLTAPGVLRPWRWPAMTRTFHFYDVLMTCKRTRQCQTWFIVTCQNYNGFYIVYFSAPPSQKCVTIWSELTKQKKSFRNLRQISS